MGTISAIKAAAWAAHQAGICVVPPREDGTKRPEGAEWATFQSRRPTLEELRAWYANGRQGVGFVTGRVSGNLETFEFDDRETYDAFLVAAEESGLGELVARIVAGYEEETPGGGIHWPMYCDEIAGNTTLARRPLPDGTRKALIQTRGEGGYIVVAPSRGRVHPTGNPYRLQSGSLQTIARVTPEERDALWRLARTFDEMPVTEDTTSPNGRGTTHEGGTRPGDDFAARTEWAAILEPHGWVRVHARGGKELWRRPGKEVGISATTNHAGSDYLYVFSSSTVFEPERGYNKFSAYAILNHGGDFAAAAGELARRGYGEPREPRTAKLGTRRVLDEATGEYTEEAIDPNKYAPSDTGNGELFAALYEGRFRFDHRRARWYRWAGHWWRGESDRHARLETKQIARLRAEAASTIPDEEKRKDALKFARACQAKGRRDALLSHAADEIALAADGDDWDADPFLFGVANGVVNLRTGELNPGNPDERVSLRSTVPYDPAAVAPRWERFLMEVFSDDAPLVAWLQRMIGYSLTGDISEHAFVVCFGTGANGKSTLFTILNHLLGDYAGALNFSALAHTLYESHPTEIAALAGRRFVTASELNDGQRLNEARIKALTGGDVVKARFMRQDEFEFRPVLKLWLAVNHKPVVADDSRGFWRRMRLLSFTREFPINHELEPELRAEASGILNWAIRGCLDWQARGLGTAAAIEEATRAYREESNPLIAFLADCCREGGHLVARANALHHAYTTWAKEQGHDEDERMNSTVFGRRVGERFQKARDGIGVFYKGVGISDAWQERHRRE